MAFTALIMGLAGSFHCLGMCSPLAMAVTGLKPPALFNRLLYNSGRILTYSMLGSLVAGLGALLPLRPVQDLLSLLLGIVLLMIGIAGFRQISLGRFTPAIRRLTVTLKTWFGDFLKKKNMMAILVMGALNGLLPCGLTVIALSWCLTLEGPLDGFNFMLLFGLGTLPAMLGLTSILPPLLEKLRWNIRTTTTTLLIVSGIVLIARAFLTHMSHLSPENHGLVDILICR